MSGNSRHTKPRNAPGRSIKKCVAIASQGLAQTSPQAHELLSDVVKTGNYRQVLDLENMYGSGYVASYITHNGNNLLHIAAEHTKRNQQDIVHTLVGLGTNPGITNQYGMLPEHIAENNGNTEMSTLLKDARTNRNQIIANFASAHKASALAQNIGE